MIRPPLRKQSSYVGAYVKKFLFLLLIIAVHQKYSSHLMSSIVLSRKEPPTSTRSISLRGGLETSQGDEMEYQTAGKHKILIDAMRKMYNGKTLSKSTSSIY